MTHGRPEPWLRGPMPGIPDALQPIGHALTAALEDVTTALADLTADELGAEPGGAASITFHVMHLAGSTDRLFTYARGESLSAAQRDALAAERLAGVTRPPRDALVGAWQSVVDRALQQLRDTAVTELDTPRTVGRAQLPSSVRGLLFHAAEHAQRHVGQIVTTAKIVRGLSAANRARGGAVEA